MSARIYTPTTDGTCAVCRRPQGEHSRSAWGAVCLPEIIIAETATLTDKQISDYGDDAYRRGDLGQWNLARSGLSDSPLAHRTELFSAIRTRLAAAINARAKAKAVQPIDATAESLGDIDFMDFSSKLRTEMDHLDGADWQAAEDLRQDCRIARVYNNADARKRVAAAINARNAEVRK